MASVGSSSEPFVENPNLEILVVGVCEELEALNGFLEPVPIEDDHANFGSPVFAGGAVWRISSIQFVEAPRRVDSIWVATPGTGTQLNGGSQKDLAPGEHPCSNDSRRRTVHL